MSPFENIVDAIHGLSHEEKLQLRVLLDEELKPPAASAGNEVNRKSSLIGLFADEPELMDQVMESVYEHRSRPLRLEE
jgi:hypothetical protein